MMRVLGSFAIGLAFFLVPPTALACPYSVRDVGFVELNPAPYRLIACIGGDTEKLASAAREAGRSALGDANVRLEVVDAERDRDHPALLHLRSLGRTALPALVLRSPRGSFIEMPAPPASASADAWKPFLEAAVSSPVRDEVLARTFEAHSVIIVFEGADAEINRQACRIAAECTEEVREVLGILRGLPEPALRPPHRIVLRREALARENILLWSLGIDPASRDTHIAILFGRCRKLGPVFALPGAGRDDLLESLSIIDRDCECNLDRRWMQGPMIPHRWGPQEREKAARLLGFDPENPRVKTEISWILSRGPGWEPVSAAAEEEPGLEPIEPFLGYWETAIDDEPRLARAGPAEAGPQAPDAVGRTGAERPAGRAGPPERAGPPAGEASLSGASPSSSWGSASWRSRPGPASSSEREGPHDPFESPGLILREALHRKASFSLGVLAVALAVAACVALAMTQEAAQRETRRVTRDLGFNLRILPRETDLDRYWLTGIPDATLDEDVLRRLAAAEKVSYNHLVAVLERKVPLGGREFLLTGLSAEISPPGERKQPMSFAIEAGTLHAGHEAASRLGLREGDAVELGGESFRVVRCLPETGSGDDVRIFGLLSDVQRVLGLKGRIGSIQAIDCLCLVGREDPLAILRAEIEKTAPEAKVVLDRKKADGRALQRRAAEAYASFAVPFIVIVCAAWIFVLSLLNVRERAPEIGILRALGHGSGAIAGLFLGKAVLLGLAGALLGWAAGTWLALRVGPGIFQVTALALAPSPALLGWALLGAPIFAAVSSHVPAMLAVAEDPATVLRGA